MLEMMTQPRMIHTGFSRLDRSERPDDDEDGPAVAAAAVVVVVVESADEVSDM